MLPKGKLLFSRFFSSLDLSHSDIRRDEAATAKRQTKKKSRDEVFHSLSLKKANNKRSAGIIELKTKKKN